MEYAIGRDRSGVREVGGDLCELGVGCGSGGRGEERERAPVVDEGVGSCDGDGRREVYVTGSDWRGGGGVRGAVRARTTGSMDTSSGSDKVCYKEKPGLV